LRTGRRYGGADLRREGSVIGARPVAAHGRDGHDEEAQEPLPSLVLP
jgi:hypothetical protein